MEMETEKKLRLVDRHSRYRIDRREGAARLSKYCKRKSSGFRYARVQQGLSVRAFASRRIPVGVCVLSEAR
jgi:hypothetical protein